MTSTDRFGIMLFIAACAHVSFLSLTFKFSKPDKLDRVLPPVEIILVHHKTPEEIEDPDYLAQATQEGGGEAEEKVRPQDKISTPTVIQEVGEQTETKEAASPQDITLPEDELLTTEESEAKVAQVVETPPTPVKEKISAEELIERSVEMARITSELSLLQEENAKKPRKKSISARTQEYKYATYMESWRQKVERIGNLNYPAQVSQQKLYGEVLIAVSINQDGTIYEIQILRSSGNRLLDDEAIHIIRLASPFAKLPKEILEETDVLEIVRILNFESNNQLSSKFK